MNVHRYNRRSANRPGALPRYLVAVRLLIAAQPACASVPGKDQSKFLI